MIVRHPNIYGTIKLAIDFYDVWGIRVGYKYLIRDKYIYTIVDPPVPYDITIKVTRV